MKKKLVKLSKFLLGDWEWFSVYRKELIVNESNYHNIKSQKDNIVFRCISLAEEKFKYELIIEKRIICSCILIWGNEYKFNFRNYISLGKQDGKIVRVETNIDYRGQGLAGILLEYVFQDAYKKGLRTLLAIIWYSNKSSINAFKKSGWKCCGIKVIFKVLKLVPINMTIVLPKKIKS